MIKIFRNIRRKLLREKRIWRYLLYAIGEIILVIVGILIALSVNNWNASNKDARAVESILEEIMKELGEDIQTADQVIQLYEMKDSIINQVLNDQVSEAQYRIPDPNLVGLVLNLRTMPVNDNGYQTLILNLDKVTPKYESVLNDLNNLYLVNKKTLDLFNDKIAEYSSGVMERWAREYPWFSKQHRLIVDDAWIDYYLNDPIYKNEVAIYQSYACQNLLQSVVQFRHSATLNYKELHRLLGKEGALPKYISEYIIEIPAEDLADYTGIYELSPAFSIAVTAEGVQLFIQATGQPRLSIFARKPDSFFLILPKATLTFQRDEEGEVNQLVLDQTGRKMPFKKKVD